jgi:hypothetical protein
MVRLIRLRFKGLMMKTARERYVRFFPERLSLILGQLDDRELGALIRLTLAFVLADGVLACDDKKLALITKTGKRWPEFRDKLIAVGLGRIEDGHWIDDDQCRNLELQRSYSERGKRGAAGRWGGGRG